jgi:hypothetical protein
MHADICAEPRHVRFQGQSGLGEQTEKFCGGHFDGG